MGIKRHRPEEIVTKLRQVDHGTDLAVLVGQGRIDAIRQVQITEQTFYRVSNTVEWGPLNSKN